MNWTVLAAALGALALGGVLYWLLITTEGTYLGARVVTLLYDWAARGYDKTKAVYFAHEARFLGMPLVAALGHLVRPRVLDVAAGTARLALALFHTSGFDGIVVGVDRSRGMLGEARWALGGYDSQPALLQADAGALAFADCAFDCVTCLEALEFMLDPDRVVRELLRVLRPGGVLLLSNRVGRDARFFPKRLCGRGRLEQYLRSLGLEDVEMQRWQLHYDLVWARKPMIGWPIKSGDV